MKQEEKRKYTLLSFFFLKAAASNLLNDLLFTLYLPGNIMMKASCVSSRFYNREYVFFFKKGGKRRGSFMRSIVFKTSGFAKWDCRGALS